MSRKLTDDFNKTHPRASYFVRNTQDLIAAAHDPSNRVVDTSKGRMALDGISSDNQRITLIGIERYDGKHPQAVSLVYDLERDVKIENGRLILSDYSSQCHGIGVQAEKIARATGLYDLTGGRRK